MIELSVLVPLLCIVTVLIALIPLLQNMNSRLGWYVLGFSSAGAVWAYAGGVVLSGPDRSIVYAHVAFAAIALTLYFSYLILTQITDRTFRGRSFMTATVLTVLALCIGPTTLSTESVVYDAVDGTITLERGILYPLYILSVAITGSLAVQKGFKISRIKTGEDRLKARLIAWAVGLGITTVITTNVIIPAIIGNNSLSRLSVLPLLMTTIVLSYSTAKHKYLDTKLAVTTLMIYASTVLITSVFFFSIMLLAGELLGIADALDLEALITILAVAVTSSMVFGFVRVGLTKVFRRIFYQETYRPQEELNKVAEVLVTSYTASDVAEGTIQTLRGSLHASSIMIVLEHGNRSSRRMYAQGKKLFAQKDLKHVMQEAQKLDKVVNTTIMDTKAAPSGAKFFHSKRVGLVARLRSENSTLGYILIGLKESGDIYTVNDERFISLVADQLAIAFRNALRYEEIERFNSTLKQKIEQATTELKSSNSKLLALDEAKDEFISMASHQLRTPLTSVKGYISMILEGDLGTVNPDHKKALETALVSSQRMVYLIADLLNVSRIQTGKFILEPRMVNLADLIRTEYEQLSSAAKLKGVKLSYSEPKSFPLLEFDENKIRQVIMNFIDNAIYYTPKGGKVSIRLKLDAQALEFTVTDTGIGVSNKDKAGLFSKFYRGQNARKERPDGTGLGLFMAKKVVEAHKGEIIFESKLNKGSTFGFRLQRKKLGVNSKS